MKKMNLTLHKKIYKVFMAKIENFSGENCYWGNE